ncbi:MAG TPA: hypothetical protein VIY69_02655 [Candidatus Acidoferrales bacterium]
MRSHNVKVNPFLSEDALRALLSFNPDDVALAEAFRASLFVAAPELEVFFSPILFEDYRSLQMKEADALVFFVGPRGLAGRQAREFDLAVEQSERNSDFWIVPVLAANARAPEGPLRNLNWIEMPVVTDRNVMRKVISALDQYDLGDWSDQSRSRAELDRGRILRQRRFG